MRSLFLLLATVLVASGAASQGAVGFKAGLNAADVEVFETVPTGLTESPRIGGSGGVWARYDVSPTFALQAEALYSQKGTRIGVTGEEAGFVIDIDYVEVPLVLRVTPAADPRLRFALYAGGAFAYKVSETVSITSEGETSTNQGDDLFETNDAGVLAGLEIGSGNVGVDLRYTHGLMDVSVQDEGTTPLTSTNGVFTAGLTFRIGR
ncbi:MAG: porin family protein [Bacteroidota bacterium]